ncbi:hypothetical protein ACET3Z_025742 [Daucus carota]
MSLDGTGPKFQDRDENGLPVRRKQLGKETTIDNGSGGHGCNPFVDKMKSKSDMSEELPVRGDVPKSAAAANEPKVFVNLPQSNSFGKKAPSAEEISENAKATGTASWANVPKVPNKAEEPQIISPDQATGSTATAVKKDKPGDVKTTPTESTEDGEWTEVKRKKSGLPLSDCEASPSPPVTFRNLRVVDEIEAKRGAVEQSDPKINSGRISKSQKKRLKASRGMDAPPLS